MDAGFAAAALDFAFAGACLTLDAADFDFAAAFPLEAEALALAFTALAFACTADLAVDATGLAFALTAALVGVLGGRPLLAAVNTQQMQAFTMTNSNMIYGKRRSGCEAD